jgi:hypothetical protein
VAIISTTIAESKTFFGILASLVFISFSCIAVIRQPVMQYNTIQDKRQCYGVDPIRKVSENKNN